ncbi:hypothetical protein N9B31_02000 [Mariniblastus sp.]|nr:hypothetical protein [Mariniblastus sp.]MDA7923807.1 hypothetical protein [Mariniblastus sp.]MDA7925475.1 hypothetical protein [Mariniblastus sp.]MDB4564487.1 hypothetical protein [Mariniblastus sp.]
MRAILTFMAMAMLVVSVGCDKKAGEKEPAKATGEQGGGAAEVAAPSTGETPAAKPTDEKEAAPAATDGAATSDTSATQTVSLKLPGMT